MKPALLTCFAAFALCAGPCLAGEAKNDFDPDVDFTRYKTFTFIGGKSLDRSGWLDEADMRERFKNLIAGSLEMRGLAEVPRDAKASLEIRYWVARREKQDVSVISFGATSMWGGYPPYWGGAWGYSYEEYVITNYAEGTLVVDLIDPSTKELVWRTFLKQKIEDRAKAYNEAKKNLYKAMAVLPPSPEEVAKMRRERAKLAARYSK
jgi:hypothetical protein